MDKKSVILGRLLGWMIRICCWTLRIRLIDEVGLSEKRGRPLMLILWHNRIMVPPFCWMKASRGQRKMSVLTSASHDGTVLAEGMSVFGLSAIRGSSSRRGVAALVAMRQALRNGEDLCVTPDGPRGPKYEMQPGALSVAKKENALVVPIRVVFSKTKTLKTWDSFQIPIPFSSVEVTFMKPLEVPKDEEAYVDFVENLNSNMVSWAKENDAEVGE